jgi:hypothetical protein
MNKRLSSARTPDVVCIAIVCLNILALSFGALRVGLSLGDILVAVKNTNKRNKFQGV